MSENKSRILFYLSKDQPTSHGQNVYEITVYGSHYSFGVDKTRSILALPIDLSESVEEVRLIHEDADLSTFQSNVLNLVINEQKVLIILAYSSSKLSLVKNKLPQDNFIVHRYDERNEEEACKWINGRSGKKFLIADEHTVAGFEFDAVIIVAKELWKDGISSLCQRATARLIVCFCDDDSKQSNRRNEMKNSCCTVVTFLLHLGQKVFS